MLPWCCGMCSLRDKLIVLNAQVTLSCFALIWPRTSYFWLRTQCPQNVNNILDSFQSVKFRSWERPHFSFSLVQSNNTWQFWPSKLQQTLSCWSDPSFLPSCSENKFSEHGAIALAAALSALTRLEDVDLRLVQLTCAEGTNKPRKFWWVCRFCCSYVYLLLTLCYHKAYCLISGNIHHSKGESFNGSWKSCFWM